MPEARRWTQSRLLRAVNAYVRDGFLPAEVLARAGRRETDDRLPAIVAAIKGADPDITLQAICNRLEAMRARIRGITHQNGMRLVREVTALVAGFFAMHPGNMDYRARDMTVSSVNFADMAALHAADTGTQGARLLAGHGARVSIITQSIPGLDNIYGENVRLSLESAAGMKLYLAANDKKTAGEISDALGKTTKLSVSDSVSRDRDFMQRRSVSRRMEERPLLTPDEVRQLNPDQAILIPERQNPLLVHRIVYFQDPTFRKLFEAQKGALPYPLAEVAAVQILTERMEALERRLVDRMVVDFVRPEKVKAAAPVAAEPKLAAEILAREEILPEAEMAAVDAEVPETAAQPEVVAEAEVNLDALKPPITISVSRMNKFSQKLTGLEL